MWAKLGNLNFLAVFLGLGFVFTNATNAEAQGGGAMSITCTGTDHYSDTCQRYALTQNETWNTITADVKNVYGWDAGTSWAAEDPGILDLGTNTLTINNSFIIDGSNPYLITEPGFWLLGADGELVINDNAKFEVLLNSDFMLYGWDASMKIEIGKLNLYGDLTYDYFDSGTTLFNAPEHHTQISHLTLNPGSTVNMKHGSALTWRDVSSASGRPLDILEIVGIGGDGSLASNTAAYKPTPRTATSATNGRYLHTNELRISLLDTGTFSNESILLTFDTNDLRANDLASSGLYGPAANDTISLSFGVVDEYGQASALKSDQPIGETFTLVSKLSNALATDDQRTIFNADYQFDAGPYFDLTLSSFMDESGGDGNLSLKATWTGYDTAKSVPLLSGMLANAAALQNAGDLLTESGISNALMLADPRYGERGFGLFSSFAGYSQTFATGGSHIDYKGFSFVGGPALNYDTPLGHLLVGAFLEGGRGNYDTANHYKIRLTEGSPNQIGKRIGQYKVKGDGDNDYLGAGLFIRHDFDPGYYAEASVRGGRINNDFSSSDMGDNVGYKTKGNYLGLHGGLGYRYEYKPGLMMDAYGKIYWTSIDGDSVTTNDGTKVEFDDADFLRTRLGVRYTASLTEALGLTFGGAWDYNFGGDDDYGSFKGRVGSHRSAIAAGRNTDEPMLKGSSGVLELGLEYKPFEDVGLSLALGGKAYLGKVEGGSGTLMLKYLFGGSEDSSYARRNNNQPSFGGSSVGSVSVSSGAGSLSGPVSVPSATNSLRGPILLAQAASGDGDASSMTLETVTVYAEPQWKQVLSPGTVSVVIPDDYQGEQKSLGDLLDTVPGLHVNKRGGSGQYTTVNVRGSTSAQVAVYIDGVPQNLGGDSAVDLSLYTADNVARIEVYKGYVPVRFTGAPIGGVINIVTKKPFEQKTTVSAGARSFGGFQANGLFSAPLFGGSMLFSASRDQSDGDFPYEYWQAGVKYNPNPQGPQMFVRDRWRKNNSHEKTDVALKWQNEKISIQGGWKEMDRYYPATTDIYGSTTSAGWVDLDSDPFGINRRNRQQVLERDFTIAYRDDWGDLNWGLEYDYKDQNKSFRWEDGPRSDQLGANQRPGVVWSVYDTDRHGLTLDAAYKLGERNMLELRGSFTKEKLDMDGSKWDFPGTDNLNSIKPIYHYEQKIYNLQLQDTITMDEDLWLTLILRANKVDASDLDGTVYRKADGSIVTPGVAKPDAASDGGQWNSTWGVALKKNVTEHWTVKATGGTFIRYPNFYELFGDGVYVKPAMFDLSNVPMPEPEKGEQWDFTVEWNGDLPWLETPGNFSATYFTRRTENMIGLYQSPNFVYYGNYGTTRASGVELEAGLKSTYLDLNFSLSWLESEIIDLASPFPAGGYGNYFTEGHRILNSPEWETNLRGDFRVPNLPLTIFAEHHYTGKVPIGSNYDGGQVWEEELHTFNLGFRAEVIEGLQLTVGVNDVFNKTPEQGFYNTGQSSWYVPNGATSTLYFPKPGREYYATMQYTF